MIRWLAIAAGALALIALAGVVVWRMRLSHSQKALPPTPVKPAPQPAPARISTIIDLPGDPALVRRAVVKAPQPISLAIPARLAADAPNSP